MTHYIHSFEDECFMHKPGYNWLLTAVWSNWNSLMYHSHISVALSPSAGDASRLRMSKPDLHIVSVTEL